MITEQTIYDLRQNFNVTTKLQFIENILTMWKNYFKNNNRAFSDEK